MPSVEGYPMAQCPALLGKPGHCITQFKVVEQPLLIAVRNEALALRIQL